MCGFKELYPVEFPKNSRGSCSILESQRFYNIFTILLGIKLIKSNSRNVKLTAFMW